MFEIIKLAVLSGLLAGVTLGIDFIVVGIRRLRGDAK